jgi:hypothetical protein
MKYNLPARRALASFALAAILMASGVGASSLPLPSSEATSSITAPDLKKHLSFLASDELGGRYTLSASNLIAARYLASQLESYGYKGAARGGSFFQRVPLSYRKVDAVHSRVTLDAGGNRQEFKFPDDFINDKPANIDGSGGLVFAGYGISSPKNKYDDYAGLDVKGKIVVVLDGMPETLSNVRLSQEEKDSPAAISHGAVGVIIVPVSETLMTWDQYKIYMMGPEDLGLPPHENAAGRPLPIITAGPNLVKALAKAMGKDSSYLMNSPGKQVEPMAIAATAEIKMKVDVKDAALAQNVVGILEGSDPKLKDEYVVLSAHYDHLKTGDRGEVYNGADDDGSGTVSVLELAQAFAMRPHSKRSILVVFHTGEELGLFGSEYNTDYDPVVPLAKLVADFNIDMIGRSRPDGDTDPRDRELTDKNTLYVIGADKLSSELNKISEQTNAETGRLNFDYTYNDERHPQRFYYRSDHYNYAKHGIPIIFYFTGVHRDYHKPTDDVDKIDFEKMERISRLIFATCWRVANLDHRVIVDKKAQVVQ